MADLKEQPMKAAEKKHHIGKPGQKIVGTGETLQDFEHFEIRVFMDSRVSKTRQGMEGYAKEVQVVSYIKTTKNVPESVALNNKHVGGCILAVPGNPNNCTWIFPKGKVKEGQRLRADSIVTSGEGHAMTERKELVIFYDEKN